MRFLNEFLKSLSRAARVYIPVTVGAPFVAFAAVEGWRAVVWLFESIDTGARWTGESAELPVRGIHVVYLALALAYIFELVRGHRTALALYLALGVLYVACTTMSFFGLFAVMEGWIPSLSRLGVVNATAMSMSVLLGAYILTHWRANR